MKQITIFFFVYFLLAGCTKLIAQFTQQGSKLVGTGNIGQAYQGISVALSADGNTALAGGYNDNLGQGAVWVFTRSGTTWTQQGSKLVGTGNTGIAGQGISVALSADGNTALVGGYRDNTDQGAVWVFTRSSTTWTQQGSKLVGTGNLGQAYQGNSVALSDDGNTALVGGQYDNSLQGAVWVYTRYGITWTQQGSKLIGTGNTGAANQGYSVALSADGNTAFVAGSSDNLGQGAVWVFTQSGVLSVELTDFTGKNTERGNLLSWATAEEVNTRDFDIERDVNGLNFEKIGTVKAKGSKSTYEFIDFTPLSKNYYRLKINDLDRKTQYSKVIALESNKKLVVKIYPSLTNGFLTIENATSFEIINAIGQVMLKRGAQNFQTVENLTHLPKGFYIVKGLDTEGGVFLQKIVRE